MKRVDYHEPKSLDEAVQLMNRFSGKASYFAGGTDLFVELREQTRHAEHVVNLKRIPNMGELFFDDWSGLHCGALVTVRELETAPFVWQHYNSLWQAARELASIPVRNRATLAGNVCRASPSADTLPPLVADQAVVHAFGAEGERTISTDAFFQGAGRTALATNEIVTGISIPAPAPHVGKAYIKHGRRKAMELATVGVAVTLRWMNNNAQDVRIVLGAVAPTPIRAYRAEEILEGASMSDALLTEAAQAAMDEARPISDVRASADYRRQMIGVLTRRAVKQALEAAQ